MDPFTIATGSAGLLSTGITVCGGLISYCRSYRSRKEDLSALEQNAQQLKTGLQLLEKRCQTVQSTDQDFVDTVNECIAASNKCLRELGKVGAKYSPPSTGSGVRDRSLVLGRKLWYPFQKDKFESFKEHIHGLNVTLSVYMKILIFDLNIAMRNEYRSQAKDLASLIFDGTQGIKGHIDTALPDLARELEMDLSHKMDAITFRLDDFKGEVENVIKDTLESMQPISPPLPELAEISTPGGPITKIPSSQATCLVPQSDSTSLKAADPQQLVPLTPVPESCSCLAPSRHVKPRRKPYSHNQLQRRTKTLAGSLRIFSYLVQIHVAIEFSQRAFLDDLRIQPNFTIRATVPSDSPAFDLIRKMAENLNDDRYSSAEELQQQARICLHDLEHLFSIGKAWPTDVNTQNFNLMDAACNLQFASLTPNMQVVPAYLAFLKGLASLRIPLGQAHSTIQVWFMFFSFNDVLMMTDLVGSREANYLVCVRGLVKTLADLGSDLWDTNPKIANPGPYFLRVLDKDMLGQHHRGMCYPDLSHALLQRSEAKIRGLLSGKCEENLFQLLQERGPWDQTPLHVSTCWPRGMQVIFELAGEATRNIISIKDNRGKTALDYAVSLGEVDSVKLLVTHGHAVIRLESGRSEALHKLQQPRRSPEQLWFLAQILADRRRQLYQYAAGTHESFERMEMSMGSSTTELLLQEDAYDVVRRLRAYQSDIPQIFRDIPPGSIYHSLCDPPVELLEALYHAGFSHTNVTYFGLCPLMTICHRTSQGKSFRDRNADKTINTLLEVIGWFQDHGADLNRLIPPSAIDGPPVYHDATRHFRLIHVLSQKLEYHMSLNKGGTNEFIGERGRLMFAEMVLSPEADPCTCFCSPKGCTTISLLAKKNWLGWFWAMVVAEYLDPGSETLFRVHSDFLRAMTFKELGMTHTCCQYVTDSSDVDCLELISAGQFRCLKLMDPEEVVEIQEEEASLSLLLEELISDFEGRFRNSGLPFLSIWNDEWAPRMAEVVAEKEGLSPEDEHAIRDIGVILHDASMQHD